MFFVVFYLVVIVVRIAVATPVPKMSGYKKITDRHFKYASIIKAYGDNIIKFLLKMNR